MNDLVLPGAARARTFEEPALGSSAPRVPVAYVPAPLASMPAEFVTGKQKLLRVLSFGLAKPQPGKAELEHRSNREVIRTATFTRCQRIAVVNPKGGIGRTPASLVLAGVLASNRGGNVAVWDAGDAKGTLHSRAGGKQERCVSAIALNPAQYPTPASLSPCVAVQHSQAAVLGSLTERAFDAEEVVAVSGVLDNSYQLHIADTANNIHSGALQMALALADILVVPTSLTVDSVNRALELAHAMQEHKDTRVVVVISNYSGPLSVAEARKLFTAAGVGSVVDVPFDPHIAAGVELDLQRLTRPSLLAWTRVGAEVIHNLELKSKENA